MVLKWIKKTEDYFRSQYVIFQKRPAIFGCLSPKGCPWRWTLLRTLPRNSGFSCFLKLNPQNNFWETELSRVFPFPLSLLLCLQKGLCREWGKVGEHTGIRPCTAYGTEPQNYTSRSAGQWPELGLANLVSVEIMDQPLFLAWFTPYGWITVVLPGTFPEHWSYVNYLLVILPGFNCSYILHNWQQ